MNERAQLDSLRVLRQDRVEQQHVGDDLEPVVVEMVLGRPERVVAEAVARLGVRDQIAIGFPVIVLAVVALVCRRPLHPRVVHIHGSVEERAAMHPDLPSGRRVCLMGGQADHSNRGSEIQQEGRSAQHAAGGASTSPSWSAVAVTRQRMLPVWPSE